MQKSFLLSSASFILLVTTFSQPCFAKITEKLSEANALKLGTETYIYGYPLITMEITKEIMTNAVKPEGTRGPIGQFVNLRKYPDSSFHDVTAPNADTLYSAAWLDLSKEPYVLNIPNENGRYYLMPMLSGWTDVFNVPGTRTTGTKAQDYVIVGPNWKGKLPSGLTEVKSPTNMVWILGRTYCTGTPEDYDAVHKLQDQYKVVPLSYYGKPYTPPQGYVDPKIDMKTPVREQVNALDAAAYFSMLAKLIKDNPPTSADSSMMLKLAKLGIAPGKEFDINKLDADTKKGLEQAVKAGQQQIIDHEKDAGVIKNGWIYSTKTGLYGTDYLQRAFIAYYGLGANRPQDAIYPTATTDSTGNKLNGANQYVIHFSKDNLPPVKGFWSLTMYNDQYYFVDNPLNKYTVSERDHLKSNADGSVDIYIQHESPGKDKEANWLPAPANNFVLMFRFYWPKETLINGTWSPPGIKKI